MGHTGHLLRFNRTTRATTLAIALLLLLTLAATPAFAQSDVISGTLLRVSVQEVRVLFTGIDTRSRPLAITRSDFDLYDDNHPIAEFTSFLRASEKHLRIAFLLDDSDSLRAHDTLEREVLQAFRAGTTSEDDIIIAPFATYGAASSRHRTQQTAMYDAIARAAKSIVIDPEHPAPAIVLLTDGEDTNSTATIHDALAAALARGIPIYALYVGDTHYITRGQQALEFLARHSGGQVLYPGRHNDATILAASLHQSLQNLYVASYKVPAAVDRPGSFHSVHLVARDPRHLRLQARAGYFQAQ